MGAPRAIRAFLITALAGVLPSLLAVLTTEKLVLHEQLNMVHNAIADVFFKYVTHLADGLVPTVLALLFLIFGTWRSFLLVGGSAGLSALIVQALKHFVFAGMDRPAAFLGEMPGAQLVAGVELNQHFSFPSGHATAAFSTCLAVAILSGRAGYAFMLAVLACVLGFSRVYLSQHFTQDVLAGALLGVGTGLAVYWCLYNSSLAEREWQTRRPFRRSAASVQRSGQGAT